jgi:hypothetical protein
VLWCLVSEQLDRRFDLRRRPALRRVSALIGATAVLTPLLLTDASTASAATSGSLTVTTLGRAGTSVATSPEAVNTKTDTVYQLTSGKSKTLPDGSYDVIVDVWNSADDTDTLGAKAVTVSGATKTTIDARQGHLMTESMSPSLGSGYSQQLNAALCMTNVPGAEIDSWQDPGHMYVIPSSLSGVEMAYSSAWSPAGGGDGDRWLGVGEHTKGLPSGLSATFTQSSLSTVDISAHGGPQTGDSRIDLMTETGDPCRWGIAQVNAEATLPYSFTAHVPAGSWSVSEDAQDYLYNGWQNYAAGQTHSLTLNRAVVGPSSGLPHTWYHQLYLNTGSMFTDATLANVGAGEKTTYTLSKSGTTLYTKTVTSSDQETLNPKISSSGWYTLTQSATRYLASGATLPSTTLSTKSSLSMHFYADVSADDQIRGYPTRFSPNGLNANNQAEPGSTTTVVLSPKRAATGDEFVHQLSDSVTKVQAWASTDGGKTWQTVKVTHSGTAWTAAVPNPRSGMVSLRSEVTDSHSDTTTTTVINAYDVSYAGYVPWA